MDPTEQVEDTEDGEICSASTTECNQKYSCRFYQQGNCIWGKNCRFLHLSDKGLYRMFESPIIGVHSMPQPPDFIWIPASEISETVETEWDMDLKEAIKRVKERNITKQKCEKLCVTLETDTLMPSKSLPETEIYSCRSPVREKLTRNYSQCDKKSKSYYETTKRKSVMSHGKNRSDCHPAWEVHRRRSETPPKRKKLSDSSADYSISKSRSRSLSSCRRRSCKCRRSSYSKRRRRNRSSRSRSLSSCRRRSCKSRRSSYSKRRHRNRSSSRLSRLNISSFSDQSVCSGSFSSESSSSPSFSVSEKISVRFSRRARSKRKDAKRYPKSDTVYHRREYCPSKTLNKKWMTAINLSPVRSYDRRNRSKGIPEKGGSGISKDRSQNVYDSANQWTPKRIESPFRDRSCSDMSISPLSNSSLSKIFEPTKSQCEKKKDVRIRKDDDMSISPLSDVSIREKANPQLEVYGPHYPEKINIDVSKPHEKSSTATFDKLAKHSDYTNVVDCSKISKSNKGKETAKSNKGKEIAKSNKGKDIAKSNKGNEMNDDTYGPLYNDLMKFHQTSVPRPAFMRCSSNKPSTNVKSTELPQKSSKSLANSDTCATKITKPIKSKRPSKKEELLRQLKEVNEAIERRKKRNIYCKNI